MEKKQIIQIVVIVGCFLGAGLVVYNGMFKTDSPPSTPVSMPSGSNSAPVANPSASPSTATGGSVSGMPAGNLNTQSSKGSQMTPVSIQQLSINYDLNKEIKKVLLKNALSYQTFQYPKINEAQIGISVNDLVKPMPEK